MSRLLPVLLGLAVGVLATALTVQAADPAACKCPEPATQKDFDPTKYFGKWLEIQRTPGLAERMTFQCGTTTFSWTEPNKTATIETTNYLPKEITMMVTLPARVDSLDSGKFTVEGWPVVPGVPDRPAAKYWVLGTDYTSYSVVYSCAEDPLGGLPLVGLSVLARSLEAYGAAARKAVAEVLQRSSISKNTVFEDVHQTSCPPASCPACPASVTASLDLDKLSGRWWEVQHSPYARGGHKLGCTRIDVSKTADGVQLEQYATEYTPETEKSNAINHSLSAKWTDASKSSGDFIITKGFAEDSGDRLCILGTDYDNWAAISMCVKIDFVHNVSNTSSSRPTASGVWLLSRKRGLSADQQMAANKAIITAGTPATDMVMTPSTPCSAAALDDGDSNGGASITPIILLVNALAVVSRLL